MFFKKQFANFLNRQNLGFLLLGFSSGITYPLTASILYTKMSQMGISHSIIGFFSILLVIHGLKFFLSPFIGRFSFKWLKKFMHSERVEIFSYQIMIASLITCIGIIDPLKYAMLLFFMTGCLIVFIVLYDLKLDTVRILNTNQEDQVSATGSAVMGYRFGNLFGEGVLLVLIDFLQNSEVSFLSENNWQIVYIISAILVLLNIFSTWLININHDSSRPDIENNKTNFTTFIKELYLPVILFIRQNEKWLYIIICLVFLQFGEVVGVTMMNPFWLDLGFSIGQIGLAVKIFGLIGVILGSFLGSILFNRFSKIDSLYIGGYFQMFFNMLFFLQIYYSNSFIVLCIIVLVHNIATSVFYMALITYISSICNKKFLTVQYSLLLSIPYLLKYVFSSLSGIIVDYCGGWIALFSVSLLLCIPSQFIIHFYLSDRKNSKKIKNAYQMS